MTYYGAKELAESMRTVRKNTVLIAEDIPEEKYGYRAAAETRSVAEMLVHIAVAPRIEYQIHAVEQRTTVEGFDFFGFVPGLHAEEKKPRSKAQILDLLRQEGERWFRWVEGLSEDFLADRVTMPSAIAPASKSRFEMLLGAKEHEMHHRGQLMLVERLLGIVPHLTRRLEALRAETARAGATGQS